MKRLLLISPAFPPQNTPDMQRARLSLPYYEENGWEVSVLRVAPSLCDTPEDPGLCATVPPEIALHSCLAVPPAFARLVGVGNLGLRSFFPMFWTGLRLIRQYKPDLILLTTAQFALFPLGRLWHQLTGVPYVLDFHDPWVSDAYDLPGAPPPPGGWKYGVARRQAKVLESWSLRKVAGLLAVSQEYINDLHQRYPWLAHRPSAAIGFGASEADLAAAPPPKPTPATGLVRLVYTGSTGASLNRVIPELLDGLALLRKRAPEAAAKLRLEFLGTGYVRQGQGCPAVLPIAEAKGVADLVHEVPHRLGHLECLAIQRDADILLLLGSMEAGYTPSKLAPYILAGRPIVALVRPGSALEAQLHDLHVGHLIQIPPQSPPGTCAHTIADLLQDVAEGLTIEQVSWRNEALFRERLLCRTLTRAQCQLFDRVLSSNAAPTGDDSHAG